MFTSVSVNCPYQKLYDLLRFMIYKVLMDYNLSSNYQLYSSGISISYLLMMIIPRWLFESSKLVFGFKISWSCNILIGVASFSAPLYFSFQ